tara:strand:+ start:6951 stop:7130 length:180 start_codon:yes stop_codon:yes gene_type:complete
MITRDEKLLEASMLLERWEKWARQYGELILENEFSKLQYDTANFFKVGNRNTNVGEVED